MSKNTYTDRVKIGDYKVQCHICGMTCWYSDASFLDVSTGRGGLLVCPVDKDKIVYGLIPYKLSPEKPIPYANYDSSVPANLVDIIDLQTTDPMSISNPKNEL